MTFHMSRRFALTLAGMASIAMLAACGGGGGTVPSGSIGGPSAGSQGGNTQGAFSSQAQGSVFPGTGNVIVLPNADGFGGLISLSPTTAGSSNVVSVTMSMQGTPPTGVPNVQSKIRSSFRKTVQSASTPLMYLQILFTGGSGQSLSFTTQPDFNFTVPSNLLIPGAAYDLAFYDPANAAAGFQPYEGPAISQNGQLIFDGTASTQTFQYGVPYVFALYVNADQAAPTYTPSPTLVYVENVFGYEGSNGSVQQNVVVFDGNGNLMGEFNDSAFIGASMMFDDGNQEIYAGNYPYMLNGVPAFSASTGLLVPPQGWVFEDPYPAQTATFVSQGLIYRLVWCSGNAGNCTGINNSLSTPLPINGLAIYNATGQLQNVVPISPRRNGSNAADGIAYDPNNGRIYVGNLGQNADSILSFDLHGNQLSTSGTFPGQLGICCMTFDSSNGDLYVLASTSTQASYHVMVYDPNGDNISSPGGFPGLHNPAGIAFDPLTQSIYILDQVTLPNNVTSGTVNGIATVNVYDQNGNRIATTGSFRGSTVGKALVVAPSQGVTIALPSPIPVASVSPGPSTLGGTAFTWGGSGGNSGNISRGQTVSYSLIVANVQDLQITSNCTGIANVQPSSYPLQGTLDETISVAITGIADGSCVVTATAYNLLSPPDLLTATLPIKVSG
jgi:hypothetical protein